MGFWVTARPGRSEWLDLEITFRTMGRLPTVVCQRAQGSSSPRLGALKRLPGALKDRYGSHHVRCRGYCMEAIDVSPNGAAHAPVWAFMAVAARACPKKDLKFSGRVVHGPNSVEY